VVKLGRVKREVIKGEENYTATNKVIGVRSRSRCQFRYAIIIAVEMPMADTTIVTTIERPTHMKVCNLSFIFSSAFSARKMETLSKVSMVALL
jgi:hypothetical protein